MKCIGYVAMVRSLEITHGQNGFHPHTHEVQFHRENLGEDDARWLCHKLVEAWRAACEKMGFFKPGDDELAFYCWVFDFWLYFIAGDYLAKQDDSKAWILAHEIAKSSSKLGRRAGVHLF
jgi:hypothetical protein